MSERRYSEDEVVALARRAYRQGQATFPVVAARSALLVIDMQDEFVRPGWTPYWVPDATRMVPRLTSFIARCRQLGLPVVFTAFAGTHHGLALLMVRRLTSPNRYNVDEGDRCGFEKVGSGTSWRWIPQMSSSSSRHTALSMTPHWGQCCRISVETQSSSLGR